MQRQNDLAENLLNLFNPNKYTEFQESFFVNQPRMTGYYYIFKNITRPSFCLILNTSKVPYPTNITKVKDFVYLVYTISSLEDYMKDLGTEYFPSILDDIYNNMQKKNERGLPYGYYLDENGDMKIDLKKANEVKRIYNAYIETESVRTIVNDMRSNFSHIRDILHDNEEYMKMEQKILPMTILKKVNELLAENVKGTFRKETTKDKIRTAKQRTREMKARAVSSGEQ